MLTDQKRCDNLLGVSTKLYTLPCKHTKQQGNYVTSLLYVTFYVLFRDARALETRMPSITVLRCLYWGFCLNTSCHALTKKQN